VRAWSGAAELELGGCKQRAVLAALLLQVDRPVDGEDLAEFVWGPRRPADTAGALHTYIGRLRAVLDPQRPGWSRRGLLHSSSQGYRLHVHEDAVDLWRFRRLVTAARAAKLRGHLGSAQDLLVEALRLWTGRALVGVGDGVSAYAVVTSLHQERLAATALATDNAVATGRTEEILPLLVSAVEAAPLHEPLHVRLIDVYRRAGRRAEALLAFQQVRCRLRDELGISPGPELVASVQRVLDDDGRCRPLRGFGGGTGVS
jgi:DNA-binding SARP family transcriptional activator